MTYFAKCKLTCRRDDYRGGKSGQHRAPYFLTGRGPAGDSGITDSATENKPSAKVDKGEKVG